MGILDLNCATTTPLRRINVTKEFILGAIEYERERRKKEIENLENLKWVYLASNYFTGNIPVGFGNMVEMTYLNISNNQFEGIIPSEFGRLSKLQDLNLSQNKLTGPIPIELGNLNLY